MTANKKVFGITGGSGSGKSYVSALFGRRGIEIIDADKIGHLVTAVDGSAYAELRAHFGDEFFAPDGTLLRRKLAKLVFSDKGELGILNEITHKHIKNEIVKRISACKTVCAIDGAVIIGSNVEELCEFFVAVVAPEDMRIKRICARDGITAEQAEARLAAQPGEEFYRAHCRYVIENDGRELSGQIECILEECGA